ncbi:hypothetical protein ACFOD4_12900 [Pseudoroseomonas globiformis]|uniref:Uncharacterized protein n=1 Tax=Teichococcus globiformis TaxID=2307229 RepID=A0ABV7G3F1_9PROT
MALQASADFSSAVLDITQAMLDDIPSRGDVREMEGAYLRISVIHGVCVEIEPMLDKDGLVPSAILNGLVIRCLIPKGIDLENLRDSLQGGDAGRLVRAVLSGHQVELTHQGGKGWLSRRAEFARLELLNVLWRLGEMPRRHRSLELSVPLLGLPVASMQAEGIGAAF